MATYICTSLIAVPIGFFYWCLEPLVKISRLIPASETAWNKTVTECEERWANNILTDERAKIVFTKDACSVFDACGLGFRSTAQSLASLIPLECRATDRRLRRNLLRCTCRLGIRSGNMSPFVGSSLLVPSINLSSPLPYILRTALLPLPFPFCCAIGFLFRVTPTHFLHWTASERCSHGWSSNITPFPSLA